MHEQAINARTWPTRWALRRGFRTASRLVEWVAGSSGGAVLPDSAERVGDGVKPAPTQGNARKLVRTARRAWPTGRPQTRSMSNTFVAWSNRYKPVAARRRWPGRTRPPISRKGFQGTTPARTTRARPRGEQQQCWQCCHAHDGPCVATGSGGDTVRGDRAGRVRTTALATVCMRTPSSD